MAEIAKEIELVVDVTKKGAEAITRRSSDSMRNFVLIATLIGAVLSAGGNFVMNRVTTDYRISSLESKVNDNVTKIADMEANGHKEHEKRITALESIKGDRTAYDVVEQGKQIAMLAEAVRADHDSIVRILAIYERDSHAPTRIDK